MDWRAGTGGHRAGTAGAIAAFAALMGCSPAAPPPPSPPRPPASASASARPAEAPVAITGTVTGPAGEPIEGAVVAAVPHFELDPSDGGPAAILTRSGAGGLFRFASLPPGRYGFTASAPGLAAAYGGAVMIADGQTALPVTLKLAGGGVEISGTVTLEDGAPSRGALVGAVPLSELEQALFATATGDEGRYSLTLPADVPYFLVADAPPRPRTYQRIDPVRQTVDMRLDPAPPPRPSDDTIASWLKKSAIVLTGAHPGQGTADLDAFRAAIGDARMVGLGEATHGSAEIFEIKHRMIELLVERMGFTTLALETGFSEALAVNDYLQTGRGDPAKVLRGLMTTPLETEEVLALIRWMRHYNEAPAHKKKLRFQGFDIVTPAAYEAVFAYLDRVDPRAAPALREGLSPLRLISADATYSGSAPKVIAATQQAITDLVARLETNKKAYVARTSAEAWEIARQHARILQQAETSFRDPSLRDPAMAENVEWLLGRLAPGEKIILWAHNTHLSFSPLGFSELGRRLRARHGKDYFVIATSFRRGGFRARDGTAPDSKSPPEVKDLAVGPPPANSLDASLALAGLPLFAIDLRTAPAPVAGWLASRMPARSVGFYFSGEPATLGRIAPSKSYDAVIFLDQVTPSHPIPR